jgi:hypothetical protein
MHDPETDDPGAVVLVEHRHENLTISKFYFAGPFVSLELGGLERGG